MMFFYFGKELADMLSEMAEASDSALKFERCSISIYF